MPQATHTPGQILWATADVSLEHRELIETTGGNFQMEVQFCSHDAFAELAAARRWRLVGMELGSNRDEDIARIKAAHERSAQLPIFVASTDHSIDTMRAVLDAGATDLLSLPLHPAELGKALLKFTQHAAPAALSDAHGEVISVYGARGGLGATTLTVNLAVKIASLTESKVAIFDLDLQRGDVSTFLNLSTAQSLATMAKATHEVDQLFLESVMTRHSSGPYVLAAPTDLEEADMITRAHVVTAIALLRTQFRYSLIDTPRTLTEATLAAFEHSDRILLLTDLSIPGIRAGQRFMELLAHVSILASRIDVLLTVPRNSDVTVEDATRGIGKPPFLIIPRDESAATKAMNAGTPLNGTRESVLSQAILDLASKLTGTGPKEHSGPLLRRLFGLRRSL